MWDKPALMNAIANALYASRRLLVLSAAAMYVARLPAFSLREVRVGGELQHVTREQVENVVRRELKGGFFTLDLAAARAAFERLPWVRGANVRRQWPARLEVALEEHVPLARWGDAALVNTHGEVFEAAYDGELPVFVGPEGAAREIAIQYRYFRRSPGRDRRDAGAGAGLGAPRLAGEARERPDAGARAREHRGAARALRGAARAHDRDASGAASTTWTCAMPTALRCASRSCATRRPSRSAGGARDENGTERMNKARDNKKLIVGLDIGTSKIAAIVAEIKPEGGFEIIGMGNHPSRGPEEGRGRQHRDHGQRDPARARGSRADGRLQDPRGLHRHRRQPHQELQLAGHGRDQGQGGRAARHRARDRDREAVQIPNDQQILHILNQEFIIDGQEDVREPLGMSGRAARSQGAHRHRRGVRRAEHHQVRAPLRAGGARPDAAAARLRARR